MTARIVLVLLVPTFNCWGGSLTLSKAFVEKVKNAAVIETSFSVDHSLTKPHKIDSGGNSCFRTGHDNQVATRRRNHQRRDGFAKAGHECDESGGRGRKDSDRWNLAPLVRACWQKAADPGCERAETGRH
jgi:hypothetical protein